VEEESKMARVHFDDALDKEIEMIMNAWKRAGLKNVSKPDVVRTLLNNYREDAYIMPTRLPRSKKVILK